MFISLCVYLPIIQDNICVISISGVWDRFIEWDGSLSEVLLSCFINCRRQDDETYLWLNVCRINRKKWVLYYVPVHLVLFEVTEMLLKRLIVGELTPKDGNGVRTLLSLRRRETEFIMLLSQERPLGSLGTCVLHQTNRSLRLKDSKEATAIAPGRETMSLFSLRTQNDI